MGGPCQLLATACGLTVASRRPASPMALCSGGKDSCYNMLLCQHYGHEVGVPRAIREHAEFSAAGCPGEEGAPPHLIVRFYRRLMPAPPTSPPCCLPADRGAGQLAACSGRDR